MSRRKLTRDEPSSVVVDTDEHWRPAVESWGLSDWESRDAFPKFAERSMSAWAWEFLRRSPEYRLTWQRLLYPPLDPETGRFINAAHMFGLQRLLDPRKSNAQVRFKLQRDDTKPLFGPGSSKLTLRANEAAFVVDLTKPVGPQLAHAAKKFKPHTSTFGRSRLHHSMFPNLLRVLDGIEKKATLAQIGRTLLPKSDPKSQERQVQRWRKQAELYRDRGYLWIAAHDK